MIIAPIECRDRLGQALLLRSAEPSDGESLLRYLQETAAETPYLIREPGERIPTPEMEERFIISAQEDPKGFLLLAFSEGQHAGNCSVCCVGPYRRYAHRCEVAIALYQRYCGRGIGRSLLTEAIRQAKLLGYEQMELEVVADNTKAIQLYESLGFQTHGRFPRNMRYADGHDADALWMMKEL